MIPPGYFVSAIKIIVERKKIIDETTVIRFSISLRLVPRLEPHSDDGELPSKVPKPTWLDSCTTTAQIVAIADSATMMLKKVVKLTPPRSKQSINNITILT